MLLLAEQDHAICAACAGLLEQHGFAVVLAENGEQVLQRIHQCEPDLLILDLELPGMSCKEICWEIHHVAQIPVILIARHENAEEVLSCMENCAVDFIMQPFRVDELLARVRTSLKRLAPESTRNRDCFQYQDLLLDLRAHRVIRNGTSLSLTRTELRLLAYFMRHAGQTLSKDRLLKEVWGHQSISGDENMVDTAIKRLRHSIEENPKQPRYIHTVWGVGFRFGA